MNYRCLDAAQSIKKQNSPTITTSQAIAYESYFSLNKWLGSWHSLTAAWNKANCNKISPSIKVLFLKPKRRGKT